MEGIDFVQSFSNRKVTVLDSVEVSVISLDDLKATKRAVGWPKDLDDLAHLP